MNTMNAEFWLGVTNPDKFPKSDLPEIAFAGRSNVGKSSLLNSIVKRKNLARTSSTPGKTREINLFVVEKQWVFADLPGFGYASIGKDYRIKWAKLNYQYLEHRENLRMVCCLIDSRHDPMDHDLALIENLENWGRKYLIILTKVDKIRPKQIDERKKQLENLLQNCRHNVEVLPYSSVNLTGNIELTAIIKRVCS